VSESGWRDTLAEEWQEALARGHASMVLAEAEELIPLAAHEADRVFLLVWSANCLLQLSRYDEAALLLDQATSVIDPLTDVSLAALLASVFGQQRSMTGNPSEAIEYFKQAEEGFTAERQLWKRSSALINHAVPLIMLYRVDEALAKLDAAVDDVHRCDMPDWMVTAQLARIAVNRSIALRVLGQDEGIGVLLDALKMLQASDNALLKGTVLLNLAVTYVEFNRHGSALNASSAASTLLSQAGNDGLARRARVIGARARARLGYLPDAERTLTALISDWRDDGCAAPPLWLTEAIETLVRVYQSEDQGEQADQLQVRFAELSARSVELDPFKACLNQLVAQVNSMMAATDEDRRRAVPNVNRLIAELRGLAVPLADVAADTFTAFVDMLLTGEVDDTTEATLHRAAALSRLPQRTLNSFRGVAVRDLNWTSILLLNACELYYCQADARSQESETSRAGYLTAGGQELADTMRTAVIQQDWQALFEVIEFARSHPSGVSADTVESVLPPFRDLVSDPVAGVTDSALGLPPVLSVGGKSLVGKAVGITPQLDLDVLRRDLAGDRSVWWSMAVLGRTLSWSLCLPGGVLGGQADLSGEFSDALGRHLRYLPIVLPADRQALNADAPDWCHSLVALARTARGPLVADESLAERCLTALPATSRRQAIVYLDAIQETAWLETYEVLGRELLPSPLRDFLVRETDVRLLVSLPPPLATLPFCLLPLSPDRLLLEAATIVVMPPPTVAELALRTSTGPPGRHILAIHDPTGDLSAARPTPGTLATADMLLTGWSQADHMGSVATLGRVTAALRSSTEEGVLSFAGHIHPGSRLHPGSSGLVLAPDVPGSAAPRLTALDILTGRLHFPSRVYLGGCEGAGFGTGLEWSSVAAAALLRGASCVIAHGWPVIDDPRATSIDDICVGIMLTEPDPAAAVRERMHAIVQDHRSTGCWPIAPYWWAGLQVIGSPHAVQDRLGSDQADRQRG